MNTGMFKLRLNNIDIGKIDLLTSDTRYAAADSEISCWQ